MARAIILHSSIHWNDGTNASLWPQAVTYAARIYNNTPKDGVCTADIFTGSVVPPHRLLDLHVWGCPLYVLDPKIQQGKKLPRWEPRSRRGIFLGLSQQHASEVPLVINLGTGSVTAHFHVVFDDLFTTVPSIERDTEPHEHWEELCLENSTHVILDYPSNKLNDEWMTEEELEVKRRSQTHDENIREATEQRHGGPSVLHPIRDASTESMAKTSLPDISTEPISSEATPVLPKTSSEGVIDPREGVTTPSGGGELRRSTRRTAGKFQTARYFDMFLARV
jgi:hypothetical protein